MNSVIRAAKETDTARLASIALAAKAFWGYAPAQLAAWREQLSPSVESIQSSPTFVALIDGEIAGFYQLTIEAEGVALEHLWVHPDYMRQGIGRALVSHAMTCAASHGFGFLSIDSDPNAEPFYASCGAQWVSLSLAPIDGDPARVRPQMVLSSRPYCRCGGNSPQTTC